MTSPKRGRPRNPEGTLEELGPKSYRIRWYDDRGRRRATTGSSPAAVRRRWLDARTNDARELRPEQLDRRAWRQIRGWLEYWAATGRPSWRGSTRRRHYYYLKAYILDRPNVWRGLPTNQLDSDHVLDLVNNIRTHAHSGAPPRPLTGASKKHFISSLSVAMREAVRRKLTDSNPCAGLELDEDTKSQPVRIIQPEQTQLFAILCRTPDPKTGEPCPNADLLEFLLWTGLRAGEARALHWSSWTRHWKSLDNSDPGWKLAWRKLTVEATLTACRANYVARSDRQEMKVTPCIVRGLTKGGKSRTLVLTQPALDILRRRYRGHPADDSPIFAAPRAGYLSAHDVSNALARVRALEALAVSDPAKRITPERVHALRHSCAARLALTASIPTVAAWLGHQDGGRLLFEVYGKHEVPAEFQRLAAADETSESIYAADFARTTFNSATQRRRR